MNKLWHICVILSCIFFMNGCGMWQKSDKELEHVGIAKSEEVNGSQIIVEATLKDKKLVKIRIDETGAKSFDGTLNGSKKELGDSYNMKSYSDIGKEWYEQINALEKFIEEYGVDYVEVNEEGKAVNPDLVTQCTIRVDEYLNVSKAAIENASK